MNQESNHIFLTGGTGFFGRSILRDIISNTPNGQPKITILSRNPNKFLAIHPEFAGHKSIIFKKGDIQIRDSLPWHDNFTHILHAAADSTLGFKLTPMQRFDQGVEGTRNILDLAIATGAHRFLFTSSGAVYGDQPSKLPAIPESWLGAPVLSNTSTAYGQAKRASEHLCHLVGEEHGLEVVIARCFTFIGSDLPMNAHFAIGNFIRDAMTSDEIIVQGDGTPLRTYLDQHDLAHWLLTLLSHGKQGQTYNVGSDEVVSIADLAHLVRNVIAPDKPVRILGRSKTGVAGKRYVPDVQKVQKELGLSVNISLREAISIVKTRYKSLEK